MQFVLQWKTSTCVEISTLGSPDVLCNNLCTKSWPATMSIHCSPNPKMIDIIVLVEPKNIVEIYAHKYM